MQAHLSPSRFSIFATKRTRAACAPPSRKSAASWAASTTWSSAASASRPPTRSSRSIRRSRREVVGIHQKAGKEHVEPAMQAALEGLRDVEPHHRSKSAPACCSASATLLRERKFEFMRVAGLRSRQELGRGRRRHRRDHRLLRVLRARSAALGQGANTDRAAARRARLSALHSAGRGRGDSAVEFPLRHHGRHDAGLDRLRQHRHPEAVERFADHRREVLRSCWKRPACPPAW